LKSHSYFYDISDLDTEKTNVKCIKRIYRKGRETVEAGQPTNPNTPESIDYF
jgi:hypothetical protein